MTNASIESSTRQQDRAARRDRRSAAALASALLLALACADASALIRVSVHAEFPSSGFTQGPVYDSVGPEAFNVAFDVDETAAIHYASGFAVSPGRVILSQDVYAFDYSAIKGGSNFIFGTQAFSGLAMHNLAFALLFDGVIAAPLFLSDITPGSTPRIEVALGPHFSGFGSYDFGPFLVDGQRTVFLTDQASMYDGSSSASGTVSVHVSAIPEPTVVTLMLLGLLPLALSRVFQRKSSNRQ